MSDPNTATNSKSTDQHAYRWLIADPVSQDMLQRFPELHPAAVQLLMNRGLKTQDDVDRFLNPDYGQDQHDPYLFRDMKKAVDRIAKAIEAKEKIVIHGDYDADGVCGSAVMMKTLQALGAQVDAYLPHRDTEGYGLNMNTVTKLHESGTNLIITVDCGISNKPEIEKAVALGMEVIVTDHHSEPPEMPDAALAVINPKISSETYPFEFLAGVGVAFKVCQALIRRYDLGVAFEKWLLDLVAISTITDFVSLVGENRVFVKYGLIVLQKNRRPGLRQLFEAMAVDPKTANAQTVGFKLGPHINAAGRVRHANMALDLVLEENEANAAVMSAELRKTNTERQAISEKASKEAMAQAREQHNEFVIVVRTKSCPVGLVGLVAGKVASEYQRPTFVITSMGEEIVGSGRSIEHFNLVEGLQSMPELFTKYGGHPMACGFTIKNEEALDEFTQRMRKRAEELLRDADLRKTLSIEMVIALNDIQWPLIELLEQCAPYGEGNPEPIFVSKQVMIESIATVGSTGKHLRLTVSQGGVHKQCIAFGFGHFSESLHVNDIIDIAYRVGVNEWNGNREIQLVIQDIQHPS